MLKYVVLLSVFSCFAAESSYGNWVFVSESAESVKENGWVNTYKIENGVPHKRQTLIGTQLPSVNDKVGYGDSFGESISMDGDWAVVAAPTDSTNGRSMGAVYVYKRDGDFWFMKQVIKSEEAFSNDSPGHMLGCMNGVCLKGDKLMIGDPAHSGPNGELHQGCVVVYQLQGKFWNKVGKVFDPQGKAHDYFGVNLTVQDGVVEAETLPDLDFRYPRHIWPHDREFEGAVPVVGVVRTHQFKMD